MLLPVTSSMVWWLRRPLMPEKSERSMVSSLRWGGSGRGGGDGGDGIERDVLVADLDGGHGARVGDAGDDPGLVDAGVVGPGDLLADQVRAGDAHLQREGLTLR